MYDLPTRATVLVYMYQVHYVRCAAFQRKPSFITVNVMMLMKRSLDYPLDMTTSYPNSECSSNNMLLQPTKCPHSIKNHTSELELFAKWEFKSPVIKISCPVKADFVYKMVQLHILIEQSMYLK